MLPQPIPTRRPGFRAGEDRGVAGTIIAEVLDTPCHR